MAHVIIFVYRQGSEAFLGNWDCMETQPLGGTEASALRMASALQALGHRVTVTNDARDLRHGGDIFVSTRGWGIFERGIRPGRLNYLWCTDDVDQPIVAGLRQAATADAVYRTVDGVMMLSDYQAKRWQEFLHLPADKIFATGNGIPADRFAPDAATLRSRPPHAYYGSTPFRGLDRLLERWPRIRAQVPNAELHVFSSMRIYGSSDSAELEALYRHARTLPGVHYHGAQGQIAIRATIRQCRVLAYPCTFPETSCITAMEAMASGCAVVSTATGALPETAAGNPLIPMTADWLERWEAEVVRLLTDDTAYETLARHNLAFTARRDWNQLAGAWLERFARDAESLCAVR